MTNRNEVAKIRKVYLTMNEEKKYETIKKLVETDGNKKRAAITLQCTVRTINRMILGYKTIGKEFFSHGNKGRKPAHTISEEVKDLILDLYRTKYFDATYTHFTELLEKHEQIKVSVSVVRSILMPEFIVSPRATRMTRKKAKSDLKEAMKTAKSKKEIERIQDNMISIEDAHPRRPRCAYFGEMIQLDASLHDWFGSQKTQLHIGVDDATGTIAAGYFDNQETLNGYYNVLDQILNNYGIPYMFYTDKRTVFEYKQKKLSALEDNTFTQFGYACRQLGIEIKTTSIPQAKGRVERMFQTLQLRLPIELRLAGITTLEQANEFLKSYLKEFNAKFALSIDNTNSVFEKQPSKEKINLILAILTERKIDSGHSIRFDKRYFRLLDENGIPVYLYKGTAGMVIKAFSGDLFFCTNDIIYALDEVPVHEQTSRNFDFKKIPAVPKQKYIPDMNHPWKRDNFMKYVYAMERDEKKYA